jgi:putative nucleotidyltransferase with HDIG domain
VEVELARDLAHRYLATALPRRWTHVAAVAAKAESVACALNLPREQLVSAAWLHDVGYAPEIVQTGFHPLDGARFLRRNGVDEDVVQLVAHHSCATVEADERGLEHELLAEFPHAVTPLADALWFCDMTTGPDGEALAVAARLAEIRNRYGPDHVVTRFVDRAQGEIIAAAQRTSERLRESGAAS